MRYVEVSRIVEDGRAKGYNLDPTSYSEHLPALAPDLPAGARAFATDSSHFDFDGRRCVKDLRLARVVALGRDRLRLELEPCPWKHDVGLRLDYPGVVLHEEEVRDVETGLGSLLLDELLPVPAGVSHELALTGGVVRITAADVRATWMSTG